MKNFILITTITLISLKCFSQAGTFDTTFSNDGIATFCFPPENSLYSLDAAFQSSGKIITLQMKNDGYLSVLRFNVDGSNDTTFGVSTSNIYSLYSPPFDANTTHYPAKMAIQADDRIIISGLGQSSSGNSYWAVRLMPNGVIDSSFNGNGYMNMSFGTMQDRGKCVAIQNNGKIILAGKSGSLGQNFAMARINSNGTLDTTFGIGGKAQTTFINTLSDVNTVAIQPDDRIILGGWVYNSPYGRDFALTRYNSNGSIDTSFGTNGKIITTVNNFYNDQITKLIVQNDGKIIAGGYVENLQKFVLIRYTSIGALDTDFGINGIAISDEFSGNNCDIAQQVDGKIILVGGFDGEVFTFLRYLNNGQLDTTFSSNGFLAGVGLFGYASNVLIQPDNKIVIFGFTSHPDGLGNNIACSTVVRLNPGTLSNQTFTNIKINVYPNPTNNNVFFDNSVNQYEKASVYNYLGQKLGTKKLDFSNNESFDISSFSKGVYLLQLENENSIEVVKIVKD